MIKASELKNEQVVKIGEKDYTVVTNIPNDVIHLCDMNSTFYSGFHLFYTDLSDVVYATEIGIDLS